jgi:opacity protein-like surface antigen
MSHRRTRSIVVSLGAFALAIAAPARSLHAQVAAGNGFLLGTPDGSITIRTGWALASAGSDIFSFTTNNLTIDRRDFSSPLIGADLAFSVLPRTDVVFSASYAAANKRSEFRKFEDNNHDPIGQTTGFFRVPLSVSVKQYLTRRGRSIGQLAWIPARFSAYVGAGAGTTWYRFRQNGDWIDFTDMSVFPAQLRAEGWTMSGHAFAGTEWAMSARFSLVTEARYERAHAAINSNDFQGFDPIDLSGLSTTAGIAVRF